MSEIVKCDLCGKAGLMGKYEVSGWCVVQEYGAGYHRTFNDKYPAMPQHFCSFGCLALWAIKYRDLIEQPIPSV